jgi:hypothetical protein
MEPPRSVATEATVSAIADEVPAHITTVLPGGFDRRINHLRVERPMVKKQIVVGAVRQNTTRR